MAKLYALAAAAAADAAAAAAGDNLNAEAAAAAATTNDNAEPAAAAVGAAEGWGAAAGGVWRVWGRRKGAGRALEKLVRCYQGEAARLLDCCRGAAAFGSAAALARCAEGLRGDAELEVVRVRNRLDAAADAAETAGYRHVTRRVTRRVTPA